MNNPQKPRDAYIVELSKNSIWELDTELDWLRAILELALPHNHLLE
jgi:hypothetical protein